MDKKVILFELNEVPFRILDEFCRWRPNSTLAKRRAEFKEFETHTEDVTHLSPWMTWPSLYRGVNDEKHQVYNFGQDLTNVDREYPPLWRLLAEGGVKTGVFGSLHTYPLPENLENYSFYVPDTFAAGSECFPDDVSVFQEFNLNMARSSGRNVSTSIPWKGALRLLAKAPGLGLKPRTFMDLGGQILSEREKKWQKCRRRTYQSVLAFDIFMKQLKTTKPDFVTFFTNHVASAMHRFWAAAFPDDYESFEFTEQWVEQYAKEIDFAMRKFDDMLTQLLRFVDANPEYELWMATSMGQAATVAKMLDTQLYPTDLPLFMNAMGVANDEWEQRPSMFAQANIFVTAPKVASFRENLKALRIEGEALDYAEADNGFFSMYWGHNDIHDKPDCVTLHGDIISLPDFGFDFVKSEERTGSNAYHIPQGSLLVYNSRARRLNKNGDAPTKVSALDIAPTLLKNYSVPVPDYMHEPAMIGA